MHDGETGAARQHLGLAGDSDKSRRHPAAVRLLSVDAMPASTYRGATAAARKPVVCVMLPTPGRPQRFAPRVGRASARSWQTSRAAAGRDELAATALDHVRDEVLLTREHWFQAYPRKPRRPLRRWAAAVHPRALWGGRRACSTHSGSQANLFEADAVVVCRGCEGP